MRTITNLRTNKMTAKHRQNKCRRISETQAIANRQKLEKNRNNSRQIINDTGHDEKVESVSCVSGSGGWGESGFWNCLFARLLWVLFLDFFGTEADLELVFVLAL